MRLLLYVRGSASVGGVYSAYRTFELCDSGDEVATHLSDLVRHADVTDVAGVSQSFEPLASLIILIYPIRSAADLAAHVSSLMEEAAYGLAAVNDDLDGLVKALSTPQNPAGGEDGSNVF